MRNKAFLILIALCGLLMAATFGLWAYCSKLKSEKERLDGNQTALLEKIEFYQTESGKSAANRKVLDYVKLSLDDVTEKKYIPKNKRVLPKQNL